jgi:hypothetical protein
MPKIVDTQINTINNCNILPTEMLVELSLQADKYDNKDILSFVKTISEHHVHL